MKLARSNSCRTKTQKKVVDNNNEEGEIEEEDFNDDKNNQNKKIKRSHSVLFDPTTQVNHPLPDIIWKATFHVLPHALELEASKLTSTQVMDLLHCGLLSSAVYYKNSKKHLPPNLTNIVIESNKSDFYRVPYFVVDSDELDTIFVAFRGSACLKDWHVDFLAAAIQYQRGHVHEGVYFTSLNIFEDIKRQIRELSLKHNKRQIILTGHSLGGAVAGMTAVLFNEEMIDLKVRAVCLAPVASFSQEVWEFSHSYIQSYINYGDLVPFISYYNTYYLPEHSLPKVTYERLNQWCIKKINKHSKRPEFRLLVETYTEPVKVPYKLIPPGDSYIIRINNKAATVEIQAVTAPQIYFGQFLNNLSAMKHKIRLYKHSIIRYTCEFFNQDQKLIEYYNLSKKLRHNRRNNYLRKSKNNDEDQNENENELESNYISDNENNNQDEKAGNNENENNEDESSDVGCDDDSESDCTDSEDDYDDEEYPSNNSQQASKESVTASSSTMKS